MVNLVSKIAIVSAALFAVLYQFVLKGIIFGFAGFGRHVENISAYPNVKCQKVDELGLEGCEHMWLHEPTGYLYMGCSDSASRTKWLPALVPPNFKNSKLTKPESTTSTPQLAVSQTASLFSTRGAQAA